MASSGRESEFGVRSRRRGGSRRFAVATVLGLLLASAAASPARAADASCGSVLRHAVMESLRERIPQLSRGVLRHVVCRRGWDGLDGIDPGLSTGQREVVARVLCAGELASRDVRAARSLLRAWFSADAGAALEACVQIATRGVDVRLSVSPGPETIVDVVASSRRAIRPPLVPVAGGTSADALPTGLLRLSGSPEWVVGGLLESVLPTVLSSSIKGARPRLVSPPLVASFAAPPSVAPRYLGILLETSAGNLPLVFATEAPSPILEQAILDVLGVGAPEIEGCVDFQGDPEVKRCTSIASYQACLGTLIASDLRDCRADIPPGESSPIVEEPIDPAASVRVQSTLWLAVNRLFRGSATEAGAGSYEVTLPTPVRPPATGCDDSCPIGPQPPCGRDCFRADSWRDSVTGAAGGLFSIGALPGAACDPATVVVGEVETDAIDAFRAWEACDRAGAWSSTTLIDVTVKAGKLFQYQDPHTTFVGGRWTWRSEAEVVKQVKLVDVPVVVECHEPRPVSP